MSDAIGWKEALGGHADNPAEGRTTGYKVSINGYTFTVASCETRIMAQFEEKVQTNALEAISAAEEAGLLEEAQNLRAAFVNGMGAGHYKWDGRACRAARADVWGIVYLLWLLMVRCKGQEGMEFADVRQAFDLAPRDFALAIKWSMGNSPAPSTEETDGATTEKTE